MERKNLILKNGKVNQEIFFIPGFMNHSGQDIGKIHYEIETNEIDTISKNDLQTNSLLKNGKLDSDKTQIPSFLTKKMISSSETTVSNNRYEWISYLKQFKKWCLQKKKIAFAEIHLICWKIPTKMKLYTIEHSKQKRK